MAIFSYVKLGKKIFGKQKTTGKTVNPFERKKMRSNRDAVMGGLKVDLAKLKGGAKKIQTTAEDVKAAIRDRARVKKMGGGMMGRRMGYSQGKLAVTPREKRLAAQYGDKKRITRGDVITAAKKKSGERMQASVGGGAGQTRKEKILFKLNKNIKNVKEKMKGPTLTKSQINTLKRKKP